MAGTDIQKINVTLTGNSGPLIKELEKAGNTANKVISQIKRESDSIARKGAAAGEQDTLTLKQNLELLKLYGSDKLLQDRIAAQMRMIELQKQFNQLIKGGASTETLSKAASAMGDVKASKLAGGVASEEALARAEGIVGGAVSEQSAAAERQQGLEAWLRLEQEVQQALEREAEIDRKVQEQARMERQKGFDSWWKLQQQKEKALADEAEAAKRGEDEARAARERGYDAWQSLQNQKAAALKKQQDEEDDRIERTLQAQFSAGQREERQSKYNFERNRRQMQALSGLMDEIGGDTTEAGIALQRYAELVDQASTDNSWDKLKEKIDAARDATVGLVAEQAKARGVDLGGEAGVAKIVAGAGGSGGESKTFRSTTAALQQLVFAADDAVVSFGTGGLSGAIRGASNNVSQFAQLMFPGSPLILGLTVAGSALAQLGIAMAGWIFSSEESVEVTDMLTEAEDRLASARERELAIVKALRDEAERGRGETAAERQVRETEQQLRERVEDSVTADTQFGRDAATRMTEIDRQLESERDYIVRQRLKAERDSLEAQLEERRRILQDEEGRYGTAAGVTGAQEAVIGRAREFVDANARAAAASPGSVLGGAVAATNQALDAWNRYTQSAEYAAATIEERAERFESIFDEADVRARTAIEGTAQAQGRPLELGLSAVARSAYRARQAANIPQAAQAVEMFDLASSIGSEFGNIPGVSDTVDSIREEMSSVVDSMLSGGMSAAEAQKELDRLNEELLTVRNNARDATAAEADLAKEREKSEKAERARAEAFAERERKYDAFMGNSDIGDLVRQTEQIRDWVEGARMFGLTEDEARRQARERFGQRLDPLGEDGVRSKAAIGVESLRTSQELVRLLSGDDSSRRLVDVNEKQLREQRRTNQLIEDQAGAAYAVAD